MFGKKLYVCICIKSLIKWCIWKGISCFYMSDDMLYSKDKLWLYLSFASIIMWMYAIIFARNYMWKCLKMSSMCLRIGCTPRESTRKIIMNVIWALWKVMVTGPETGDSITGPWGDVATTIRMVLLIDSNYDFHNKTTTL